MDNLPFEKETLSQPESSEKPKKKIPWWVIALYPILIICGFLYGYYGG